MNVIFEHEFIKFLR